MTEQERMENEYRLNDFNLETSLLNEQLSRESVELSQFNLETQLIEKGAL